MLEKLKIDYFSGYAVNPISGLFRRVYKEN